jgi:hypothetical protein
MRKAERKHERAQRMGAEKRLAMVKRQLAAIGKKQGRDEDEDRQTPKRVALDFCNKPA